MSPTGFLSRDPIGYEGSQWNLYEYCRTNPFKYNDPHGDVPILIPVAGAVIIITEAEAVAAAFGLSVFACLQNQQCRAAMDQAVRNAVNRLDRAAQRALKLACSSAHRAYKAVENSCGRCDKRKAPTCFEQTARCISASLSFGCFQTAAGLRAAYVASGCDVVSPTLVNHPGAANQALMASENCAKAMENNCFQPIF